MLEIFSSFLHDPSSLNEEIDETEQLFLAKTWRSLSFIDAIMN